MLWTVRHGCNPHLYPCTFQSSQWMNEATWEQWHGFTISFSKVERNWWHGNQIYISSKSSQSWKSSISKAHYKEASGEMKNGTALTHGYTMPLPPSALDHEGWTQCNWQGDASLWSSEMNMSISMSCRRQLELLYVFLSFGQVVIIM